MAADRLQSTLASLERAVARAKEMLAEEYAKADALFDSPEWTIMTPQECASAVREREQAIRHAQKNLAQAEKSQRLIRKRAKEYGR